MNTGEFEGYDTTRDRFTVTVEWDDIMVYLSYGLHIGTLQLAFKRQQLGYHVQALQSAFEHCFGEPTPKEIAEWQAMLLADDEKT